MPSSWSTIAQNEYDALGQLKKKKLGATPLDSLVYDYNIRGWMLGANRSYVKDTTSTANWFGFDQIAATPLTIDHIAAKPLTTDDRPRTTTILKFDPTKMLGKIIVKSSTAYELQQRERWNNLYLHKE